MPITGVELVIAGTGIVSECLLVVAWAIRGRHRPFWLVGLYALYHLLYSVSLRVLHLRRSELSDALYCADYALDFGLLSGVIVELSAYAVRPLAAWPVRIKRFLVAGLAAGTVIPFLLVMSQKIVGLERSRLRNDDFDLVTSLLLCTFLFFSTWTEVQLRVPRSTRVRVLRWGLVIWVGATLIINLCRIKQEWAISPVFGRVSNALWVLMILFWATAILMPDDSANKQTADSLRPEAGL